MKKLDPKKTSRNRSLAAQDAAKARVDVGGLDSADSKALAEVSALALRLVALENAIDDIDSQRASLVEEKALLESKTLPGLMTEIGLKDFRLASGEQISIKPIIAANLPSKGGIEKERDPDKREEMGERMERGFAYLEKNGAGSLIKNTVQVDLGKGSSDLAKKVLALLRPLKLPATVNKGVHPSSLSSWVKERIENGKPVDFEIFAVYTGERAEIKLPKEKGKGKTRTGSEDWL